MAVLLLLIEVEDQTAQGLRILLEEVVEDLSVGPDGL